VPTPRLADRRWRAATATWSAYAAAAVAGVVARTLPVAFVTAHEG
jgi:hypothetical protein